MKPLANKFELIWHLTYFSPFPHFDRHRFKPKLYVHNRLPHSNHPPQELIDVIHSMLKLDGWLEGILMVSEWCIDGVWMRR